MIRAYDTISQQYADINDYIASLGSDDKYGIPGDVTAIATHADGIKCTCDEHKFIVGQRIAITGTTSYDGVYEVVTVVDEDNFTVDVAFVADEDAVVYPVMDSNYYIAFLHGVEDLFNTVKKFSALKGKTMKGNDGNFMISEYALTNDRRDIFDMLLERACNEVASPFIGYSKNILNAYKYNALINFDGQDGGGTEETIRYIQYMINENRDYIVVDQLSVVDARINDSIVSYVLKEWYYMNSLTNDFAIEQQRFDRTFADLKSALMKAEGRKPLTFTLV